MRKSWCWLLPLLVGCSGQNVVAGQEKTKQEQLAEALPAWCQQYCETLNACDEGRRCDCRGDSCGCAGIDVESCTGQCQKELQVYTLGAERCADLGRRFTGCLEKLSCEDLFGAAANDCEPTGSEQAVCRDDGGYEPSDEIPSQVGGSTSTAGSASTSHGTAGSAYGLPGDGGAPSTGGSTSMGGTAGSSDYVSCSEISPPIGTGGTATAGCQGARTACSDGAEYFWACALDTKDQLLCSCFVDARFVASFAPMSQTCPSLSQVNAGCGFALQQ